MEVGAGRWKERDDGEHHGLSLKGGERGRDLGRRRDDVVDTQGTTLGLACRRWLAAETEGKWGQSSFHLIFYVQLKYLKVNERLASGTCTMVRR